MVSSHGYFDPVPQLGRTDTGGQVVYVLQLARGLSTHGIKVDIYTRWFDRTKTQIDAVTADGRVIRIPAGPWSFVRKEEVYDYLPELAQEMLGFIRRNHLDYDLFHGHYVDGGMVAVEVAKALEKPTFFTAHSLGAWKRDQMGEDPGEMERKYNFGRRIDEEARIFKSVRAQIVTSGVQREKLRELYDLQSGNIAVMPPGVDVHRFYPARRGEASVKTGLPDRYVFCLSRIDSNKGHDLLLNAFGVVRKTIPDVHLIVGGGSATPQETELEVLKRMREVVDHQNLHEKVHIVGYVPDDLLATYYRQAELFALPSIFEPFGITALEAMACGKAVIASKFGGIREVISSGENGLLIDPADTGRFADAMMTLLNNPQLADRMGRKAMAVIRRTFSWEAIAERHIGFFQEAGGVQ
jgi:mannosylfructose-phosphate synthase